MTRRGLTLVEVLASAVLLTLIASASVPVLRQAGRALREPPRPHALFDLARFADKAVQDPDANGFDLPVDDSRLEVPWPDEPDWPAVTIRRLQAGPDADHVWLTFTCEPWTVVRWVAVDPDVQEPEP